MTTKQDRRERFREILAREQVTDVASVYDPVSARMAEDAGFEVGIFAGSIASHVILGAPDLCVITLSELAEQVRRISRTSALPFWVDGDHGYGNALSVTRTIQEIEDAGAAAVSIEDTSLPARFQGSDRELISIEEFTGKLKAAVDAKQDPSFVVVGRTSAFATEPTEAALRRIQVCVDAGVDCIHIAGGGSMEQLEAISRVTSLPLILSGNLTGADAARAAQYGVRLSNWTHLTFAMVVQSLRDAYGHLVGGGAPAALQERAASTELMQKALAGTQYGQATERYLR